MKTKIKKLLYIAGAALFIGVFTQFSFDSSEYTEPVVSIRKQLPPYLMEQTEWYDSVYKTLSTRDRLTQMLMIPAYPKKGEADVKRVANLIKNYNVGGIIFFQGTPERVHELANYYQSISRVPLLIAIDGEWGLRMRLSNTIKYPKQMTLGAVTSDMLLYYMGRDIAKQMKHLGVHINFAPVVDINNNPKNPVINSRSFGEHRVNVAKKSLLYMKGMQDEGILAFAKHFPGHGDTEVDSHKGLPIVNHTRRRLDSLELYPFRALINAGVGGVMMAHMYIPELEPTKNLPSTLSSNIADSLLQKRLAYKGLVVTDGMNMKGVADFYKPVEANYMAVQAGNDIILMPYEVENTVDDIMSKIEEDSLLKKKIDKSCLKILKAKDWAFNQAETSDFSYDSINTEKYTYNRDKLVQASITVVKNEDNLLPLKALDTLRIASLALGDSPKETFYNTLALYAKVDKLVLKDASDTAEVNKLKRELKKYNLLLLSLHSNSLSSSKQFGFTFEEIKLSKSLMSEFSTVLIGLSNPYVLSWFNNLEKSKAIVAAYENMSESQLYTVEAIFGAIGATGRLPVTISNKYKAGHGIKTFSIDRLKYVSLYEAGVDKKKLLIVDSLVNDAIEKKAMPGCQVLAAKDGKVFFNKAYGYHTYHKRQPVKTSDIYDIASITKIAASVPSVIRLQHEKKIDINEQLSEYMPALDTCSKGDMLLSDMLLHQAGLVSWIPFYRATLEPVYPSQEMFSNKYSKTYPVRIGKHKYANKHIRYKHNYYNPEPSGIFTNKVANGLYMNKMYEDSIWHRIASSELGEPGNYKYSDLGFYLFYKIIEQQSGTKFDKYTDSVFYSKLGAYSLGFNPLSRYSRDEIVPTENDIIYRRQVVHGYVHDPGAAMLGGVSGHAGLFGNANDLAKIMQMFLNGGRYGGEYYLNRKLVKKFTSCQECNNGNRRGLGFDKPQPDTTLPGPSFKGISTKSFGHTGFTGTMAWADPETGIVYIFLSNRVYPDATNNKLVKLDVRTNIQKAIYNAILRDGPEI